MVISEPGSEPRIHIPGLNFYQGSDPIEFPLPYSIPGDEERLLQPVYKMIARVTDELRKATYRVDLTAEGAILHAGPSIVKTVIDCLESRHSLTHRTLILPRGTTDPRSKSSPTTPRLPSDGFKDEDDSYEPFVHLLNKVVDAANQCISASHFSGLRFHHFGNETKRRYSCTQGLKPDGVGIIGELLSGTDSEESKLPWEDIEVIVESKRTVAQMIHQSALYTRFCLLNNRRRFFAIGIGLHFTTLDVYIVVFHRSGFSSSRPLKLTTEDGFRGLVRHIVGILSSKGEVAYGRDTSCTRDTFYINNRYYEIIRPLYMSSSPLGNSTVVHSLSANTNEPSPLDLQLESRMLSLSKGVTQIPDRLTYKQIYPIKGHSQEGAIFSQFIGQFGIADVIGYYNCGPEEPHGSTRPFLVDAEIWDPFENQIDKGTKEEDEPTPRRREPEGPEERGLQCIALAGEGKALLAFHDIDGGTPCPGELLESILHAIIGHYKLFNEGILHRDVSSGNVIRYLAPIERPALDRFECTRNVNRCRAFLIDGDHAVKWREFSGSRSISGTIPFMSVRLLTALQLGETTIHSALDDLESFLWLLIWGIVHASKDIEGARAANKGIELMLHAWSGDECTNISKHATAKRLWRDAVFGDLIKEWLRIFDRVGEETRDGLETMPKLPPNDEEGPESQWHIACDWLESHCINTYEEILESGFKHLENVKKYSSWKEVVATNSEMRWMIF